ncbi:hypothetical protein M3S04_18550 [Xanthomonas sp. PPL139]|uniref:hypothetical protein n=1 Tax=unclassified Xanthomonas TaxID=2643310 RepID=UPI00339F85AD
MKLYGKSELEALPLSLAEVTLQVSTAELREVINFLEKCDSEMKSNDRWEHAHLQDFLKSSKLAVDIVVYKG